MSPCQAWDFWWCKMMICWYRPPPCKVLLAWSELNVLCYTKCLKRCEHRARFFCAYLHGMYDFTRLTRAIVCREIDLWLKFVILWHLLISDLATRVVAIVNVFKVKMNDYLFLSLHVSLSFIQKSKVPGTGYSTQYFSTGVHCTSTCYLCSTHVICTVCVCVYTQVQVYITSST